MKVHVVFDSGEINYFGSNIREEEWFKHDAAYLLNIPGTNVLSWKLNDQPVTQKFISLWEENILNLRSSTSDDTFKTFVDVYLGATPESMLFSRQRMNDVIDSINSLDGVWFTIPDSLKLNASDIDDVRVNNLNRLHEIFETEMDSLVDMWRANTTMSSPDPHKLWSLLQSVNMIVHFNEKIVDNTLDEQSYFTAAKFTPTTTIEMTAEDYADFTIDKGPADLFLDFATVGKDLMTCAVTNDIELVHQGMVSTQAFINPWIQFGWNGRKFSDSSGLQKIVDDWLRDNEVSNYLDLTDPKYNLGRHKLGDLVSHTFSGTQEFLDTIIAATPRIFCFIVTDDENNMRI